MLLQLLQHPPLTHSKPPTLHFTNTIFIMTSNLAPTHLNHNKYLPFNVHDETQNYKHIKAKLIPDFKPPFTPHFINPIHQIILFHSLQNKHLKHILSLISHQLTKPLKHHHLSIQLTQPPKPNI
ncbi:AAA family ATPase, partial [Bacillus altitudinis]|uniref:AAA family ATPase n=1 Tax=Bacillus altitudinis TaxID=293387 RepID=UPI003B522716